jgi:hypothetical protein
LFMADPVLLALRFLPSLSGDSFMEDNSHAGQGPVLLDIGGDIGAVILSMPATLDGVEIEARPVAGAAKASYDATVAAGVHPHSPGHDHSHSHGHSHPGGHSHSDGHSHGAPLVHVGVLGRPAGGAIHYSAVFSELQDGQYELYIRPDGPVELTVTVRGGEVTTATWPA